MKVKLWCATHDFGSNESEIVEVADDTTDAELDEMAKDYFYERKEPEWWFEKLE